MTVQIRYIKRYNRRGFLVYITNINVLLHCTGIKTSRAKPCPLCRIYFIVLYCTYNTMWNGYFGYRAPVPVHIFFTNFFVCIYFYFFFFWLQFHFHQTFLTEVNGHHCTALHDTLEISTTCCNSLQPMKRTSFLKRTGLIPLYNIPTHRPYIIKTS